ncbi:hypothetical protein IMG5_121510 [Ichthyophthirius multifiliis]|uniref:Uncharacterized protein n=1 Tax=Ichthyophthirius multifiliis TaxID=5932 RepID=G0QV64_ICHMU|nr:hypothetical protein IMG5_121510 [Ichthyophthirius multifiliis]EGR30905.1 hypothetical protein IMG5_121510 [Ichthyophthirius multifiliis]|eukprot:XP_004032492.1 hypothetical protein IMG5_121510 [Ichthyophthirius multifiliis]
MESLKGQIINIVMSQCVLLVGACKNNPKIDPQKMIYQIYLKFFKVKGEKAQRKLSCLKQREEEANKKEEQLQNLQYELIQREALADQQNQELTQKIALLEQKYAQILIQAQNKSKLGLTSQKPPAGFISGINSLTKRSTIIKNEENSENNFEMANNAFQQTINISKNQKNSQLNNNL